MCMLKLVLLCKFAIASILYLRNLPDIQNSAKIMTTKKILMNSIGDEAILKYSESLIKLPEYAEAYDKMMEQVYNNLTKNKMIKNVINTFLNVIRAGISIKESNRCLDLKFKSLKKLLDYTQSKEEPLKRLYNCDIKLLQEYTEEESFFAFFNMILNNILYCEIRDAWLYYKKRDIKLRQIAEPLITQFIPDENIKNQYKILFVDQTLVTQHFELSFIITDTIHDSFLNYYENDALDIDFIIYELNKHHVLQDILTESNAFEHLGCINKIDDQRCFDEVMKIFETKLKAKFAEYGQKLRDKRMTKFYLIENKQTLWEWYRTYTAETITFDNFMDFQRYFCNLKKLYNLVHSYVELVFMPHNNQTSNE